jgi:hypothetical protein
MQHLINMPESDFSNSDLQIELPPGVRLEDTSAASAAAYRIVARQPEKACTWSRPGTRGS